MTTVENARRKVQARRSAQGFTLIELLVSLVIGLLIVLGATQLFIVSKQSFDKVESLGLRQGTLNFAVDVLSRDIRRANRVIDGNDVIVWDDDEKALSLGFSDLMEPGLCDGEEIVQKTYSLRETTALEDDHSLSVAVTCRGETDPSSAMPLVSGFTDKGFDADERASGLWKLTFRLAPIDKDESPKRVDFLIMNRMYALTGDPAEDDEEDDDVTPGYDSDGNRLYPNSCYRGSVYDPDKPGCKA